jgi:hypothetical protein
LTIGPEQSGPERSEGLTIERGSLTTVTDLLKGPRGVPIFFSNRQSTIVNSIGAAPAWSGKNNGRVLTPPER